MLRISARSVNDRHAHVVVFDGGALAGRLCLERETWDALEAGDGEPAIEASREIIGGDLSYEERREREHLLTVFRGAGFQAPDVELTESGHDFVCSLSMMRQILREMQKAVRPKSS